MTKRILCLIVVSILIHGFFPINTSAHGTGYRILENRRAIVIEFYYSGGEPLSYAQVLVFSPQDRKTEYQNGRTDRKGRFAFYPDIAGAWRIEVSDGMGHKVEAEIGSVSEKPDQAVYQEKLKPPPQSSKVIGAVAGLSLILNLVFVVYLRRTKRQSRLD